MDILVRLTVPNAIYQFYNKAAAHILGATTEDVMADALSVYAGMLSEDIAKECGSIMPPPEEVKESL